VTVKVSVVVPVYNPGQYIDACIQSLLSQSLPSRELELLFVNDGSTDDSLERLEGHAAGHPQMKVLSIPNSGWPGKPRNVGTDAAAGEYVMFVDQDDQLEPESLQRMYELGSANSADVVLGKVISDFRGVNHALYRSSRPYCTVYTANLMNSLTPHKMLRTAFLREHGIRYPEGPRRLEDQLFMTQAYFAARGASIVADYVCYRYLRRADRKNAGSKRIVPAEYYSNLGEVLDVIDAYTEPGDLRDGFYRRFLRTEVLGRLDAPNLLKSPQEYLTSLVSEIRGLLTHRFPLTVDSGMGPALRCRAALTREESTLEAIARQAESIRGIQVHAWSTAIEVSGNTFHIGIEARLLHNGSPLTLEHDSELGWLLPAAITDPIVSRAQRRVEDPASMSGDVVIKHRDLADQWFLPSPLAASIESSGDLPGQLVFRGTAMLDPLRAAGGESLRTGLHDLLVRLEVFGISRSRRLDCNGILGGRLPVLIDDRQQINRLYRSAHNKLSVNVDALPKWLSHALRSAALAEISAHRIVLDLGVVWAVPPPRIILMVVPESGRGVSFVLHRDSSTSTRWQASVSLKHLRLPLGEHRARLKIAVPGSDPPVRVTMQTPFPVTPETRRAWLLASFQGLPSRGRRRLARWRRRTR
jgi:poly(ribitol-phosphate) beta-N-acetylglucosaminyltransferase